MDVNMESKIVPLSYRILFERTVLLLMTSSGNPLCPLKYHV